MRVIDYQEGEWFLYESSEKLLLEVNCNHSFVGYIYTIELNEEELNKYNKQGHDYLSELAYDIHFSAPIIKNSKSIYIGRDVTDTYSKITSQAVKEWRANEDETLA